MSRTITALILLCLAMAGCATYLPGSAGTAYCIKGTLGQCSQLEGSGDCQPCPQRTLAGGPAR